MLCIVLDQSIDWSRLLSPSLYYVLSAFPTQHRQSTEGQQPDPARLRNPKNTDSDVAALVRSCKPDKRGIQVARRGLCDGITRCLDGFQHGFDDGVHILSPHSGHTPETLPVKL